MSALHASLTGIPMPDRIKRLPRDHRGFPVPWFVAWIDGQADHRVIGPNRMKPAIERRLCWVCGDPLGRYFTSLIGCMCAVNRVISEPPSHRDCAEFSVRACPFLSRPQAHRREIGLPDERTEPGGFGLKRNPGVTCLWISREYPKPFRAYAGAPGVLFQLGDPVETVWYREGRLATRDEVLAAIEDGLPNLMGPAQEEGPRAVEALLEMKTAALQHLPIAA